MFTTIKEYMSAFTPTDWKVPVEKKLAGYYHKWNNL
jgi:hypothetical protein